MSERSLTGTAALARAVYHKDRVRLWVWATCVPALVWWTASSYAGLYPTVAERQRFAATVSSNSTLVAFTGPPRGLESVGGFTAWRLGSILGVLVGLMSVFLVVRNTRAEEESGRAELLRSAAVGRIAQPAAALIVVTVAEAVLAALCSASLLAAHAPATGALVLGAGILGMGAVFSAAAALAAQAVTTGRAALAIGSSLVAASIVLRGIGDTGPHWVSWLSPVGWVQAARPYAGNRWAPLAILAAVAAAGCGAVVAEAARRDMGAGLFPSRPGAAGAAGWVRTPLTMAWRLNRTWLIGFSLGSTAMGLAMGGVAKSANDIAKDNPALKDALERLGHGADLTEAYLASILGMVAAAAAGCAVSVVLRARAEETAGRAEAVLATGAGRRAWVGSQMAMAALGIVGVMLGAGLGTGITGGNLVRELGAALAHVPAAAVVAAAAAALVGLAPRRATLGWLVLAAAFTLTDLGGIFQLPQGVIDASPFSHTPALPAAPMRWVPVLVLTGVALALAAAGVLGFQRRDIG